MLQQQAVEAYQNGYYSEKLQQGLEYQDYVTDVLYQHGLVLVGYSSKKFQNEKGENVLGAEIKRDGKFRKTGNLYIELAEKSHPDKENYTQSGINRDDNSWLYIIGDEKDIYIFSVKYLNLLKSRYKQVQTPTSIGLLVPLEEAKKYCIKHIQTTSP